MKKVVLFIAMFMAGVIFVSGQTKKLGERLDTVYFSRELLDVSSSREDFYSIANEFAIKVKDELGTHQPACVQNLSVTLLVENGHLCIRYYAEIYQTGFDEQELHFMHNGVFGTDLMYIKKESLRKKNESLEILENKYLKDVCESELKTSSVVWRGSSWYVYEYFLTTTGSE